MRVIELHLFPQFAEEGRLSNQLPTNRFGGQPEGYKRVNDIL